MANRVATYECIALKGTSKAGVLTPDESGYYTLPVGAINVRNQSGILYKATEEVKAIFESPQSDFVRSIEGGNCKGEVEHPKLKPGQSMRDYIARLSDIDLDNVCCTFRKIWLNELSDGSIEIMAELKPTGPKGVYLKEALDNPDENVCFSIRSLVDPEHYRRTRERIITYVKGFDWVNEGGIKSACKYNSPALESLVSMTFTDLDLEAPVKVSLEDVCVATETDDAISNLRRVLKWDSVPTGTTPPSMHW